jgi:hypothetical protein
MPYRKAVTMKKLLTAASLCGVMALAASAQAQSVDVKGDTAGATALTESGVTKEGSNPTAGVATAAPGIGRIGSSVAPGDRDAHIVPKPTPKGGAGNMARLNGDESADAPGADLKNLHGADAQAARTADATAHRTVYDPNNQLGTSTEGHTQPVPGASTDASAGTAVQQ